MLKTPRGSIGKRIPTRQAWIRDFKSSIKRKELEAGFSDAEAMAKKSFAEVFGPDAKIGAHMEPISADEYAGYNTKACMARRPGDRLPHCGRRYTFPADHG